MKKNTKKKFRDIRNAVVMMCVMVAMMSTASYAWFTMTSSPTVTGMQMTAAATSGLQISLTNADGSYADAVIVTDDDSDKKVLKPVTLVAKASPAKYTSGGTDYIKFNEAVYSGDKVTGLSEVPGNNIEKCVARYRVFLKSTDTNTAGTYGIGIICGKKDDNGDFTLDGGVPTTAGSVVKSTDSAKGQEKAEYAIRVGLLVDGEDDLIVWEPNSNASGISNPKGAEVQGSLSIIDTPNVKSEDTGVITTGTGNPNNTSEVLFEMDRTQAKEVEIFIWLEGSDADCVDQIQTDDIAAQIQFTVVEETTS